MNRVAYLNCEVKSRDLTTRLLIASHLVRLGVSVVVGQVWALTANAKSQINLPGAYLFSTTNKFQAKAMSWVKDAGHIVVASDEEILPAYDPVPFVTPEAVNLCDYLLIDTEHHAAALRAALPSMSHKISVTGPVRLETLMRIKIEPASTIPYILFNTGSGVINSIRGNPEEAIRVIQAAVNISDDEAQIRIEVGQAAFGLIIPLIKWLSRNHRVVVRPHPSERAETWREAVPEVEIVESSLPLPWIKGATVVIHNNSTTGLEAATMGIPVLNLDPVPEWGKRYIAPDINCTARTFDKAKEALEPFLEDGSGPISDRLNQELNFAMNGAENTARAISDILQGAEPITNVFPWAKMNRDAMQKDKFTTSLEEVEEILKSMNERSAIHKLDDSVFFLKPGT